MLLYKLSQINLIAKNINYNKHTLNLNYNVKRNLFAIQGCEIE